MLYDELPTGLHYNTDICGRIAKKSGEPCKSRTALLEPACASHLTDEEREQVELYKAAWRAGRAEGEEFARLHKRVAVPPKIEPATIVVRKAYPDQAA